MLLCASQVDLICPSYAAGTSFSAMEYSIIYIVSRREQQTHRHHGNSAARRPLAK